MRAAEELLKEFGTESVEVMTLIREMSNTVSFYRRQLERAELDELTGLPANKKFREYIAELEKHAQSVGIIFFDVNNLKYYNDNMGHSAGDLLLQKAAESFQLACGPNDRVFRIGGDEFAAVLTGCVESDIDIFLARWRDELTRLNNADDDIFCSVAAGAAFGDGDYKINVILELADERMYADKAKLKAAEGKSR